MVGSQKGIDAGCSIEGVGFSGLLRACGGRIIRDIICNEHPRIFHARRSAYATPAVMGAVIYFAALRTLKIEENIALGVGFLVALAARIAAFGYGIHPLKATGFSEWRKAIS